MEVIILSFGIFLVFGGLWVTDKLGWTKVFRKREAGSSSLAVGMLSLEHTFAADRRRAAIEYRLGDKRSLHRQQAGDPCEGANPEP